MAMKYDEEESAPLMEGAPSNPPAAAGGAESRGLFLTWKVVAGVGLMWVASLSVAARSGQDPLMLKALADGAAANPTTLAMMKRTHLSIDSIKEGDTKKKSFKRGHG